MPDEFITPRLVDVPQDREKVEFEYDGHIFKGEFIGGRFLADSEDGEVRQRFAPTDVCWRPLPSPKPTLPAFVEARIGAIGWTYTEAMRERIVSCFAWPHNPPRDGDIRLVPQTYHRLPYGHQITNPKPE